MGDERSEQYALAAVLRRPALYPVLLEKLAPAHFGRDAHRRIFGAMGRCIALGLEPDALNVRSQLDQSGELPDVGEPYLLSVEIGLVGVPVPEDAAGLRARCDALLSALETQTGADVSTSDGPIDDILRACHLARIPSDLPADAIERRLVALREHPDVRRADALRLRLIRQTVIAALERSGARGPAGMVDAALAVPSAATGTGEPRVLVRVERPAETDVDGAAALDAVCDVVRRYLVLPPEAVHGIGLWIAHTYAMDAWQVSPILLVTSPTRRCGKTRLLLIIHALAARALAATNVTPAVLFRLIERERPTLLLDEADTWLTDERSELRGLLNAGFTRGTAMVPRCVSDTHDVAPFSTWAPKLLAMIGKPQETLRDRSLIVEMRRRLPSEAVGTLRSDRIESDCAALRARLARWTADRSRGFAEADPAVPGPLDDRAADLWRPLLAIADAAGGTWPERARTAAVALSGDRDRETGDDGPGLRLLADLRSLYGGTERDALRSAEMIGALTGLEERPWREYSHGTALTPAALARLLRPYGVVSADLRFGQCVLKGYRLGPLQDAWARYLGPTRNSATEAR